MDRLADIERRLSAIEQTLGIDRNAIFGPYVPNLSGWLCNCAPNTACGNAACPRRLNVTAGHNPGDLPSGMQG